MLPHTTVFTTSKAKVRIGLPIQLQLIGLVEHQRVAVRGRKPADNPVPLSYRLAAKFNVAGGNAKLLSRRRNPAQQFFYGKRCKLWILA
jgi:hypothetical protein